MYKAFLSNPASFVESNLFSKMSLITLADFAVGWQEANNNNYYNNNNMGCQN